MNEQFQLRFAPCRCQCTSEIVRYCGDVFSECFGVYLGSPVTNAFAKSGAVVYYHVTSSAPYRTKQALVDGARIRIPFKIKICS